MPDLSTSLPTRLLRFLRRRPSNQLFFFRCLVVVAATRVGLSVVGYRRISGWFSMRGEPRAPAPVELGRVAWGVRAASRLIPGATCLTQALAGQYLLGRAGIASTVRIGVNASGDKGFAAHAWLVSDSTILLGAATEDPAAFTPLTDLTVA